MREFKLPNRPVKVAELTFDKFYDQISNNWQKKANDLQIRRQRALKRAMKDDRYIAR